MYNSKLLEERFIKKSNNNFTLLKDNLFFRNITFQNFQILKMISFLVRDKNWNNYDPKILNYEENFDTSLEYIFDLEYGIDEILKTRNVILFSKNSITLSSEGEFLTDFWTIFGAKKWSSCNTITQIENSIFRHRLVAISLVGGISS